MSYVHPRAAPVGDLPIRDLTSSGLTNLWLLMDGCTYEDHALGIVVAAFLLGGVQAAQHPVSLPGNGCSPALTGYPTRSSFFSRRNHVTFSRCMQGVKGLIETLYSLLLPLLSTPKAIKRLNYQQTVFGRCQLENGCVF